MALSASLALIAAACASSTSRIASWLDLWLAALTPPFGFLSRTGKTGAVRQPWKIFRREALLKACRDGGGYEQLQRACSQERWRGQKHAGPRRRVRAASKA